MFLCILIIIKTRCFVTKLILNKLLKPGLPCCLSVPAAGWSPAGGGCSLPRHSPRARKCQQGPPLAAVSGPDPSTVPERSYQGPWMGELDLLSPERAEVLQHLAPCHASPSSAGCWGWSVVGSRAPAEAARGRGTRHGTLSGPLAA